MCVSVIISVGAYVEITSIDDKWQLLLDKMTFSNDNTRLFLD